MSGSVSSFDNKISVLLFPGFPLFSLSSDVQDFMYTFGKSRPEEGGFGGRDFSNLKNFERIYIISNPQWKGMIPQAEGGGYSGGGAA